MDREEAIKELEIFKGHTFNKTEEALNMAIEALEQEPIEVEATKLQMAYNQGFEDCRKAVMDLLSEVGKLSLLAMVADLASVNPQEPKYCDRNICIKNEYNGIGCDECEVTKSQEAKIGHWIRQTDDYHDYYECEHCGIAVGLDDIKNYCPNCGAKMESEE